MDAFVLLGSFLGLMIIGMPVAYALGLAARQAALPVNTLAAQAAWAGFGNSVT
mgnify:CR=1 FL=1